MKTIFATTISRMAAGGGLVPVETNAGRIGQWVKQDNRGERGIICEVFPVGYTVIFEDGSFSTAQQFGDLSPFLRITACDNLPDASAEVVEIYKKRRDEYKIEQGNAERARREKWQQDYDAAFSRYTKEYAGFDQSAGERLRASKNIRRELKKAFPWVAFRVTGERSTVDVYWTDGPNREAVGAIVGKYEECSFDSSQDMKVYDNDATRRAMRDVIGAANYVMLHREISDDLREKVHRELFARHGVAYPGGELYNQQLGNEYASHISNEIIGRASFGAGDEFAGLDIVNGRYEIQTTKTTEYLNGELAAFTARQDAGETPGAALGKTVTLNPELNGIEICFTKRFGSDIAGALWDNGFRWHKRKKLYYAKDTPERRQFAETL